MNSQQRNIVAAILVVILALGVFITLSAAQAEEPDRTAQALNELKTGQETQSKAIVDLQKAVDAGFSNVYADERLTQDAVASIGKQVSDLSAAEATRDEMTQSKLDSIQKDTGVIRGMLQRMNDVLLEPIARWTSALWKNVFGPKSKATRSGGASTTSASPAATAGTTLPQGNVPHPVVTVETIPDPAELNNNEPVLTPKEPDGPFPTTTTTTSTTESPASTTTTTVAPGGASTTTTSNVAPPPATGEEGNEPSPPVTLEQIGS